MAATRARSRSYLALGGIAIAAAAIALRIRNAIRYDIDMGFDAQGNWEYIDSLRSSWALLHPEASWSAAHPPLFYALSAAISALLGHPEKETVVIATRLFSTAVGLLAIASVVHLVRRSDPGRPARAWLSGALLLFLPVHLYMSAMLSEEILVSSLATFAVVGVAGELRASSVGSERLLRTAALGGVAGLALLTKLSGLLVIAAGGLAYAVEAWRRRDGRFGLTHVAVFGAVAAVVGGWFYVRSWLLYGYLYPHGLELHGVMSQMPPGARGVLDYLRFPLAALADPDLLSPEMLHSVWGSTYASIWFDPHRHFLPLSTSGVRLTGIVIGILALLPTAAFLVGCTRGARRLVRKPNPIDALLLGLVVLHLVGFVAFTWRNPVFVTVKGSFLLGLAAPFGYYASEVLASWAASPAPAATHGAHTGADDAASHARASKTRRVSPVLQSLRTLQMPQTKRLAIGGLLAALWLVVSVTFAYQLVFTKGEFPGLDWEAVKVSWRI